MIGTIYIKFTNGEEVYFHGVQLCLILKDMVRIEYYNHSPELKVANPIKNNIMELHYC